ncbi:MAG: VTC domain-containing protein [Sedimentisphaerales bacterium]|nr:VTC domain-containing protein [Sedimentisphaerales bacterium]
MIAWIRKQARSGQSGNCAINSERLERKFYLPSSAIPFATHLLIHCCPADRQYPRGTIHSVYYDTLDLEHFNDSVQGDHSRKKVRIRWYDDPQATSSADIFVELKSKRGYAGTKYRKMFSVASQRLDLSALRDNMIPYPTLLQTISEFGYRPQSLLYPMVLISYRRLRFIDMLTGTRISLDWNIRSRLIGSQYDRREGWLSMEGGIIEIKGHSMDLPPRLQSIRSLGTDWSRYSKYAGCIESHLEESGSAGRFWPSGRVEKL